MALGALVWVGCGTTDGQKHERGPKGTFAYLVPVESSEPGVRVEVNNEFAGRTPFTLKVFGDRKGRFHNLGNHHYTVTAFPIRPGQQPQSKVFATGGLFSSIDMIPKTMFFDFGTAPEPAKTNPK